MTETVSFTREISLQ